MTEIQQTRYSFNISLKLLSLFNGALLHILSLLQLYFWQSVCVRVCACMRACMCMHESRHCNSLTAGSLSKCTHTYEILIRLNHINSTQVLPQIILSILRFACVYVSVCVSVATGFLSLFYEGGDRMCAFPSHGVVPKNK